MINALALKKFDQKHFKKDLPEIKVGDSVKVTQKLLGEKEKTQVFEGIVIAIKHGQGLDSTFTVRNIIAGVGVERIYPRHSPLIEKIEILKRSKVRRAKLYYLRGSKGKKVRIKAIKQVKPEAQEISDLTIEAEKPK